MSRLRGASVAVGLVGVAGVLVVYLASGVVDWLSPVRDLVGGLGGELLLVVVALWLLLVVAVARVRSYFVSRDRRQLSVRPDGAAEADAADPGPPRFGAIHDDRFETITRYTDHAATDRSEAREALVGTLRTEATLACVRVDGLDRELAAAAVDRGTWTDRRRAAALLAGEEGPSTPALLWLWDVLRGRDPLVVAVEETVAALEGVYADPGSVSVDIPAGATPGPADEGEPGRDDGVGIRDRFDASGGGG